MILGFSTKLNDKPTYFIEKIWNGLLKEKFNLLAYHRFRDDGALIEVLDQWDIPETKNLKIHTIREDKNNRWKAGMIIDFFINVRTKKMFRFAPVLPVISTQKVEIKWYLNPATNVCRIEIDNKSFACAMWHAGHKNNPVYSGKYLQDLVRNDGFDNVEDFFAYFNKDFTGKIIHWTDLRY